MKKKKALVKAIFLYLLLTTGVWTFLLAYTNSRNRYTSEKTSPAAIVLTEDTAKVSLLEHTVTLETGIFLPESRIYFTGYMLAPDEARLGALLISLADKL